MDIARGKPARPYPAPKARSNPRAGPPATLSHHTHFYWSIYPNERWFPPLPAPRGPARSAPTPTARAWHAAGRKVPRSAKRRVRGNCAEEAPVHRDGKQGRRRSWLGTSGGILWSVDDAGPAARGRGHRPLPLLTRSMRSAQAADLRSTARKVLARVCVPRTTGRRSREGF